MIRLLKRLVCGIFGHSTAKHGYDRGYSVSTYQKQSGQWYRIYDTVKVCGRCRKEKSRETLKMEVPPPAPFMLNESDTTTCPTCKQSAQREEFQRAIWIGPHGSCPRRFLGKMFRPGDPAEIVTLGPGGGGFIATPEGDVKWTTYAKPFDLPKEEE